MNVIYKYLIPFVIGILLTWLGPKFIHHKDEVKPYTTSVAQIQQMHDLHLTRFFFEQIIPIERNEKLRSLIIVPAYIDAFIDLEKIQLYPDSLNYKFSLPDISLTDVTFLMDSARIYSFKHFGIYFSTNAYDEAVKDLQQGMSEARQSIKAKAINQNIYGLADNEAKEFIRNWVHSFTDKQVIFVRDTLLE